MNSRQLEISGPREEQASFFASFQLKCWAKFRESHDVRENVYFKYNTGK